MSAPGATTAATNPYLPHSLRTPPVPPAPPYRSVGTVVLGGDGLPIGTAAQILKWVGEDPDRAAQMYQREKAAPRPRATLVSNLRAVLKRRGVEVDDEPIPGLAEDNDTEPEPESEAAEPVAAELAPEDVPARNPEPETDVDEIRRRVTMRVENAP